MFVLPCVIITKQPQILYINFLELKTLEKPVKYFDFFLLNLVTLHIQHVAFSLI